MASVSTKRRPKNDDVAVKQEPAYSSTRGDAEGGEGGKRQTLPSEVHAFMGLRNLLRADGSERWCAPPVAAGKVCHPDCKLPGEQPLQLLTLGKGHLNASHYGCLV